MQNHVLEPFPVFPRAATRHRHSCNPRSALSLVSTEMAGCPWRRNSCALALMCSNCAFRSGCEYPSLVLRLACRLYFWLPNNSATSVWLTWCPCRRNSSASLRTLLQVERSADSGSPRVNGSTRFSKSRSSAGSFTKLFFRPPPFLRHRVSRVGDTCGLRRNSEIPTRMARGDTPLARATSAIPPWPIAWLSAAAHSRRIRSSRNGAIKSNRSATSRLLPKKHFTAAMFYLLHLFSDKCLERRRRISQKAMLFRSRSPDAVPP